MHAKIIIRWHTYTHEHDAVYISILTKESRLTIVPRSESDSWLFPPLRGWDTDFTQSYRYNYIFCALILILAQIRNDEKWVYRYNIKVNPEKVALQYDDRIQLAEDLFPVVNTLINLWIA